MRDYGTATWEGGDANCDHRLPLSTTRGGPRSTLTSVGAREGVNANTTMTHAAQYRDTCGKCGARRVDQQIGIEATPEEFVARLVEVFREVRRILHPSGVAFINLGDSYNGSGGAGGDYSEGGLKEGQPKYPGRRVDGLKPKDLIGIPWMVAFALRADGWWLRSEIIWHKKAPMPESVTDRPTKAHEQVFLLAKSPQYFYDATAIAEDATTNLENRTLERGSQGYAAASAGANGSAQRGNINGYGYSGEGTRNKRSVWTLGPEQFRSTTQTSRLQRVELYEVSDDTICKVSASCPVHGGLFDQVASEPYGVRVDELFSRTGRKRSRRAPKLTFGSAPTAQPDGAGTAGENSDLPHPPNSLFAIDHDMPVRRTALALATNSLDTASVQTLDRTDGIQEQLDSAVPSPHKSLNNIGSDGSASSEATQPVSRNIHTDTVSVLPSAYVVPPECTCSFYHEITEYTSHYATMPTKLVEPCILAGSSQRGCCAKCSAPWERVTEHTPGDTEAIDRPKKTAGMNSKTSTLSLSGNGSKEWAERGGKNVTTGWAATCQCQADVVPCVVLDPFFGSGTVGSVALKHHRRFIGIDLDERNIELAHTRIERSQPLLFALEAQP